MRLNFLDKFADNVTMKKYASYLIILFLFSIIFSSCKYDLISAPKNDGNTSTSLGMGDTIEAPTGLSASQGLKRKIVLSWDSVKNAKQYQIFAAETPFDSFVQQGETSGTETSFTIEESYGQTRYFLVKAVNYYGTVSSGSTIVSGTTLDVPIITEISANGSGESMNIYWWMGNEEAYQNKVSYSLSVYTENDSLVEGLSIFIGDDKASAIVNGLSASTEYKFTVEAKNSDGESEISDKTTKETAHKIIPSAAKDLKASQGEAKDKVILSWTLPEFIDYYDKKTQIYSECPLYFTIERKLTSAADSSYQYVSKYVGSSDSSLENAYNFGEYEEGKEVTFEDTSAVRGKQYSYRVRSYTDTVSDTITSDDEASLSYTEGWKLSEAAFSLSSVHNTEESDSGTKIVSVSVDFDLSFDSLQKEYIYEISEVRTDFSASESDQAKVIKTSDKIEDLSSYLHTIAINEENKASVQGFYSYTFNIKDTNGNVLESLAAANTVTVTDDADLIPEITSFTIKDGYKDKFILSWNAIEDAEYTLIWNSLIDGELSERESLTLSGDDYSVNDDTVTYEHTALSGESRYYTLTAVKNGIPDSKQYGSLCQTLGTAKPVMDEPDYSTITIQWPSVQKADSDYVITAYYVDDSNKTSIIDEANTSLSEEEGIVTCTITKPEGYDDWKVSGKAINFSVAAKNTDTGDQTSSENIEVRTLGPALVGTEAEKDSIQETRLIVRWNKIDGAKGYIIYRTKYMYDDEWTKWEFSKADTYYYNTTTDEILANGETASSSQVKIALSDNTYTLTDYYCAQTDTTSAYQTNQAQINWGIPYGYVILPVKGNKDDFNFGSDEEYLTITSGNSNVIYTSALKDEITATTGFGLNIAAQKAENTKTQKIEWYEPYFGNSLTPTLYRRLAGTNNLWRRVDSSVFTSTGTNQSSAQYSPSGVDSTISTSDFMFTEEQYLPYEYAIRYTSGTSASTTTLTDSYLNLLSSSLEINKAEDSENGRYTYSENVDIEQKNKGYLLNIPIKAGYGGNYSTTEENELYYSEKLTFEYWDYDTRSLGPDSYSVYMLNADLSADWVKVSQFDKNLTTLTNEDLNNLDLIINQDGTILRLWPKGIKNGTSNTSSGLLKVLREPKHYYKIVLTRNDISVNGEIGSDYSIYGYRQATNEEIAKAALLELSYAFYLNGGGLANYSNISERLKYGDDKIISTSNGGNASFTKGEYYWTTYTGKYHASYSLNNFAPEQITPSGITSSFLSLTSDSSSNGGFRISGTADYYIYHFASTEIINITNTNSDLDINYDASIEFTCSSNKSFTLKITRNSQTETLVSSTSSEAERKVWFPMYLNGDSDATYALTNTSYGWWN